MSGAQHIAVEPWVSSLSVMWILVVADCVKVARFLEQAWDLSCDPMSDVMDVHLAHLRRKGQATNGALRASDA
ncbi:MAG: hypothetical protein WEA09_13910 [Gemmatimonadota bacterium]